jgi:damage-control phosphatase, subfamily I
MNSCIDCLPCLLRQTLEAARMSTEDVALQETIMREILAELAAMDFDRTTPIISGKIHEIVRRHTGVVDPYKSRKDLSTARALEFCDTWARSAVEAADPFDAAVRLAIAGNVIDLAALTGITHHEIEETLRGSLTAQIAGDSIEAVRAEVEAASDILYLADNAGETVFDRFLIERIGPHKVTYVVKGYPSINDAVLDDARHAGLDELVSIIDNGSDVPGTVLELCPPEFRERFAAADLVIAKGQGNYESLSDSDARVIFLLKAKCDVVARALDVPTGSLVVKIKCA